MSKEDFIKTLHEMLPTIIELYEKYKKQISKYPEFSKAFNLLQKLKNGRS